MRLHTYVLCAFVFSLAAFAQSTGTITGTIEDPAGAVVPGAPVEVKNMDTGTIYKGGASGTGNYVIPVPVGNYELSGDDHRLQEVCAAEPGSASPPPIPART